MASNNGNKKQTEIDEQDREWGSLPPDGKHARVMEYLSTIQASQAALMDSITFMRNNHMIYTASIAKIVSSMLEGNEHVQPTLDLLNRSLQDSERHFERVTRIVEESLEKFKYI